MPVLVLLCGAMSEHEREEREEREERNTFIFTYNKQELPKLEPSEKIHYYLHYLNVNNCIHVQCIKSCKSCNRQRRVRVVTSRMASAEGA